MSTQLKYIARWRRPTGRGWRSWRGSQWSDRLERSRRSRTPLQLDTCSDVNICQLSISTDIISQAPQLNWQEGQGTYTDIRKDTPWMDGISASQYRRRQLPQHSILALQSGAHRRGAFRDFHPIAIPNPIHWPLTACEHLSLYVLNHSTSYSHVQPGTARYSQQQPATASHSAAIWLMS